ncbi:Bromodomain-containing protein, partial [Martensiomyces pterosporus]
MRDILARVANYKDSDGELLSEVFEELPDKTEYPEYYEVIAHPMALNLVKSRIAAGYRSFDAFDYDMLWIFNNATFFNESDSQIYQDAVTLE